MTKVAIVDVTASGLVTVSTFRAASRYNIKKLQAGGLYRVAVPDSPLIAGTTTDTVQM